MLIAIYSIAAVAGLIVVVKVGNAYRNHLRECRNRSRECRNLSIDLQHGFTFLEDTTMNWHGAECQVSSRPTKIRKLWQLERDCIKADPPLNEEELGELLDRLSEWAKAREVYIRIFTETEPVIPTVGSVKRLWSTANRREASPGGEVEAAVRKLEGNLSIRGDIVPSDILQDMTRNKSATLTYIDTMKDYAPYEERWQLDLSKIVELANQELARRQALAPPVVARGTPRLVTELKSKK